jgi:NAD(P)-dependent dehydrogenase (short-subunit alcohol dehydrogenase family)
MEGHMLSEYDLAGRKALVTGAGRGIGKGIALVLAEAGCDVAVTSFGQTNADKVAAEITAAGRRGFGYAVDGTKVEPMQAVAHRALADLGGLDILVNCIGDAIRGGVSWMPGSDARVMSEEDWHFVVDVNLTQAYVGCHVFGPHMLEQRRGVVINVSGFAQLRPSAMTSAYAAAKAGLGRFTESLALEWAPYGVRVNAIAPGSFPDPEQTDAATLAEREATQAKTLPIPRFGRLRECGLLTAFLASDAAAYITGQTVAIDGGRTIV